MVLPEFVELLSQAGDVIDLGPFFGHFLNRVQTWLDETGGERFLQLLFKALCDSLSAYILPLLHKKFRTYISMNEITSSSLSMSMSSKEVPETAASSSESDADLFSNSVIMSTVYCLKMYEIDFNSEIHVSRALDVLL